MRHASSEVPATAASNDPNNAGDLQSGVETRTPAEVKADGMTLWRKVVDFTDKECAFSLTPEPQIPSDGSSWCLGCTEATLGLEHS